MQGKFIPGAKFLGGWLGRQQPPGPEQTRHRKEEREPARELGWLLVLLVGWVATWMTPWGFRQGWLGWMGYGCFLGWLEVLVQVVLLG